MPYCSSAARSVSVRQLVEHLAGLHASRRCVETIDSRSCVPSAAERPDQTMSCSRISAAIGSPTVCTKRFGILDPPRHIALDHEVLLVARQKLRRARIVDPQPPVEIDGRLEGPLHVQPGIGDGVERACRTASPARTPFRARKRKSDRASSRPRRSQPPRHSISDMFQHHRLLLDPDSSCGRAVPASAPPPDRAISTPSSSRNRCRRPLLGSTIIFLLARQHLLHRFQIQPRFVRPRRSAERRLAQR